ncbi:MAG: hypothetical protein ACK56I_27065, partial [bacterium]
IEYSFFIYKKTVLVFLPFMPEILSLSFSILFFYYILYLYYLTCHKEEFPFSPGVKLLDTFSVHIFSGFIFAAFHSAAILAIMQIFKLVDFLLCFFTRLCSLFYCCVETAPVVKQALKETVF